MYVQAIHFFRSIFNYNCLNFKRHVFTKLSKCIQLILLHAHSLAGNLNGKWKRQMEPMTSKLFFIGLKSDVSL